MADDLYSTMIQKVEVSANLGREVLEELGRVGPYHPYVSYPPEDGAGDRPFTPDWYSPPGDTIRECLRGRGLTGDDLAVMLECTPDSADRLLAGDAVLTEEIAERLARGLGATQKFWLRREATYRRERARIEGGRTDV